MDLFNKEWYLALNLICSGFEFGAQSVCEAKHDFPQASMGHVAVTPKQKEIRKNEDK